MRWNRKFSLKLLGLVLLFVVLSFFLAEGASAMDVTLAWDANTESDLAGYRIYYKPGASGGRKLNNYPGQGALEGDSPIDVPLAKDENADPDLVEFTLHDLDDNKKYFIVVAAYSASGMGSLASREISVLGSGRIPGPYSEDYDRGWEITDGDLKGFKVFYHSSDGVIPTLGPSTDVPALNLPGLAPVGVPLNLEPSGVAPFNTPVAVSIPCPGHWDVHYLSIGLYDGNGWVLACDGEYGFQEGVAGWMESYRKNNKASNPATEVSTIEIKLHHFSGVQAASVASAGSAIVSASGGGCFISSLAKQ